MVIMNGGRRKQKIYPILFKKDSGNVACYVMLYIEIFNMSKLSYFSLNLI